MQAKRLRRRRSLEELGARDARSFEVAGAALGAAQKPGALVQPDRQRRVLGFTLGATLPPRERTHDVC
jgi:hypothetical protein